MQPKEVIEQDGRKFAALDDEGRVLYDNEGAEFAFDAGQTYSKIQELQGEAKTYRQKMQEREEKLKQLEGIDPEKYWDAQKQLEKIDQGKMVEAGEVDKLKKELEQSFQESYGRERDEALEKLQKLESQYNREKLSSAFSGSKFVSEQLAVPPDMAMATFGDRFKMEDGKMVAYGEDGPIYSRKNPGSYADFDEAMEQIVESYPYRDRILKASNQSGTGGEQGGQGGKRKISRAEFENANPAQRAELAKAMAAGEVVMGG